MKGNRVQIITEYSDETLQGQSKDLITIQRHLDSCKMVQLQLITFCSDQSDNYEQNEHLGEICNHFQHYIHTMSFLIESHQRPLDRKKLSIKFKMLKQELLQNARHQNIHWPYVHLLTDYWLKIVREELVFLEKPMRRLSSYQTTRLVLTVTAF